jgi:AcrR family transcriptional regulator
MSDTRTNLLDAATQLLDSGGTARVTLRDVGAQAGVSHNAPYKHFRDKESLLAAIAAVELETYRRILDSGSTLSEAAATYVSRLLNYPHRFRLVYGPWTRDHEILGESSSAAYAALIEAVERAQTKGELGAGRPDIAADLLRSTAHGAVELELSGHLEKGQARSRAVELTRALLAALQKA